MPKQDSTYYFAFINTLSELACLYGPGTQEEAVQMCAKYCAENFKEIPLLENDELEDIKNNGNLDIEVGNIYVTNATPFPKNSKRKKK